MIESKAEHRFENIVTLFMALVTLWGAFVAVLENQASIQEDIATQKSQVEAAAALGELIRADQLYLYELEVETAIYKADWQSYGAELEADYAEYDGNLELSAALNDIAETWDNMMVFLEELSPVIEYEELHRQSYYRYELQQAYMQEAKEYGNRADALVSVISMLAAVLFLMGLSLSLESWVRKIFLVGALLISTASIIGVGIVMFNPINKTSRRVIDFFLDGLIASNQINWSSEEEEIEEYEEQAIWALSKAIELAPFYANAYEKRAEVYLQNDLGTADPDRNVLAAADYLKAIELGDETFVNYTNMGWALILAGDFEKSIPAHEQAIKLKSDDCYSRMNLALTFVALERSDDAEEAYENTLDCILKKPPYEWDYLVDAVLTDLEGLKTISPDLPNIEEWSDQVVQMWVDLNFPFVDDFSDPPTKGLVSTAGFDIAKSYYDTDYEAYYVELNPGVSGAGSNIIATYPGRILPTNFRIDVEVTYEGADFSGPGIIFQHSDDGYYVFQFTYTGVFAVNKPGEEGWEIDYMVEWEATDLIHDQPNETNTFTVEGFGDVYNLYINGEQVASFTDSSYSRGSFGLYGFNFDDNSAVRLYFDNFKLENLDD